MYNRYIPQPDGTYRRTRIPEQWNEKEVSGNSAEMPSPVMEDPLLKHAQSQDRPHRTPTGNMQFSGNAVQYGGSVGGFLRTLLPDHFDAEDLIVVLLLLLISGNSSSGQNTALITLVIYLFL